MAENIINKKRESKNNVERLRKLIANPRKYAPIFLRKVAPLIKDDETYLKLKWRLRFGEPLNLDNPQTFNEKLQWLKLHDRKPEYTRMVDKYEAKKYVAEKIGEEYIIPTLGVWDSFDDIDFNSLPNQFVLKCTHDSGGLVICKDKSTLDMEATRKKLEKCLKRDYYIQSREWPYKNVKPRIIAEKYMEEKGGGELKDYKLHCFNGEPKMTLVCSDRFAEEGLCEDFFDNDWGHLPTRRPTHPNAPHDIACPKNFELMKELAKQLSKNIPFVRVDFYEIDGRVYFGELTFFPMSGMGVFVPNEWDLKLGEWMNINFRENKKI